MHRDNSAKNKIAILATGDEISNGDILNTNAQNIANRLFNAGMQVGIHATTPDNIDEIEAAITFLLQAHRALIITGGLGPTSDDLTRFALGKALNLPLVFDEKTWETICKLLKKYGYHTPPENNRQQALFPEGAKIIQNEEGTAASCLIEQNDKFIFMLPGPPNECLPVVDRVALPTLKKAGFSEGFYYQHWLLFGASEGKIAEELDKLAKNFDVVTGYRLCYPYIEFKLFSHNEKDFNAILPLVEKIISPYFLGDGKQLASRIFETALLKSSAKIGICDRATGGELEAAIKNPKTLSHLFFANDPSLLPRDIPTVVIDGLEEYWQEKNDAFTEIKYSINDNVLTKKIPYRGKRVKQFVVEFICHELMKLTTSESS